MYIAGQAGYTLADDFNDGVFPPTGGSFSDLNLHDSVVYGGKVGYYFSGVRWLGVETEVFNTTPNVKQQTVTLTPPGAAFPNTPGFSLRVLTWATNVVVRYPGKQWQPYGGVGLGVFFARADFKGAPPAAAPATDNDNAVPGLNAFAGLRYFPVEHLALFAEYKYNRASFDFPVQGITNADYSVHHFVGGAAVHF
jgi:opacity protein-like surface antigen